MLTPSDAAKQKGITSSSSTINNQVIISALESSINTIFHFFSHFILISWQVTAKSCAYPLSRVICSQRQISCSSLKQPKSRQLSFHVTSQNGELLTQVSPIQQISLEPPSFPSGNRRNLLIVAIKKSGSFLGERVVIMSTQSAGKPLWLNQEGKALVGARVLKSGTSLWQITEKCHCTLNHQNNATIST